MIFVEYREESHIRWGLVLPGILDAGLASGVVQGFYKRCGQGSGGEERMGPWRYSEKAGRYWIGDWLT